MSTWAARAKLHLSQDTQKGSAKSDETPLLSLMAPHFGALCEKRDSANDPVNQVPAPPDGKVTARVEATPDPDRWAWPHSNAMTGAEIDVLNRRVIHFITLDRTTAETLADRLVTRDREGDDRSLCVECRHCRSGLRCSYGLPVLDILQRCDYLAPHPNLERPTP